MAIHGEIKVNGQVVGRWYAQRILTSTTGNHTYRWEAWDNGRHVTGDLRHEYTDGAMRLAQRVFTAALEALAARHEYTSPHHPRSADSGAPVRDRMQGAKQTAGPVADHRSGSVGGAP